MAHVQRRVACRAQKKIVARYGQVVTSIAANLALASRVPVAYSSFLVCCSKQEQQLALPVGVTAGLAAVLANPLVAEAGVTPSLKNLLFSVVAGATVLGLIAAAVTGVSSFDPLKRGR